MKKIDFNGSWYLSGYPTESDRTASEQVKKTVRLPGTLDTNGIGHPDLPTNLSKEVIKTRLTRKHTYEGPVVFSKEVSLPMDELEDQRVFLEVERSRDLQLRWNHQSVAPYTPGTLSTPYCFEVTSYLQEINHIELHCDNSYPNWPKSAITYSSTATDETQTNWNGILGEFCLHVKKKNFIRALRIYPKGIFHENHKLQGFELQVKIELDCATDIDTHFLLRCPALGLSQLLQVKRNSGKQLIEVEPIRIEENYRCWDENDGQLYELEVVSPDFDSYQSSFGLRDIQGLRLNGRKFFLRSESNCCVFPQTGHMPMDVDSWLDIIKTYQAYGVNSLRFHSHCPPKAAFIAADRLGILLQPELSHWDPAHAFEEEKSQNYYRMELEQILDHYANHPSFVMLSLGNELHANEVGHQFMDSLLQKAKSYDATRLYANGSNVHYGNIAPHQGSDFYTASNYYDSPLRACYAGMEGYLNHDYPNTLHDYEKSLARLKADYSGPVFSFEVGQYEVLPDFDELNDYTGVTQANNIDYIRQQVQAKGKLDRWKQQVEASGELSRLAYREEVEAVLRSPSLSGISLLGLQDFPGQGTALVGMLNPHLKAKPFSFARPERFREFFTEALPLALFPKYTYTQGERFHAQIKMANYSKKDARHPTKCRILSGQNLIYETSLAEKSAPSGQLSVLGNLHFSLEDFQVPKAYQLEITYGPWKNSYTFWVYADKPLLETTNHNTPASSSSSLVLTANYEEALEALCLGKKVFFNPPATKEALGKSISSQFTTDFWSVGTFSTQSGCMGCQIQQDHPAFAGFPTEFHSNYQWWPMTKGRSLLLPSSIEPLISVLDCYAYLRHMGLLFEAKVGSGNLLFSSMGLLENQEYPEVRALLHSLVAYMESAAFSPSQELMQEDFLAFRSPSYEK